MRERVARLERMRRAFTPGDFGHALYPSLEVRPGDLTVRKYRFSALVQGASDLDSVLRARGIDTRSSSAPRPMSAANRRRATP